MEAQVNIPKWHVKFEKSFPAEIIGIVNDVPKSETPQSYGKTEGLNPWVVAGVLAIVGITVYMIWKQNQDERKREQASQTQIYNNLPGNHNPNTQN